MKTIFLSVTLSLMTLSPSVQAQGSTERRAWATNHPFALGTRASARASTYVMAGLGGQVRIRLFRRVAIDLFTDHFVGEVKGALRHDHEVGATLQYVIAGGDRWSLQPLLGACAVLAVQRSPQSSGSSVTDIYFGLHTGLGAEFALGSGFALQTQAQIIGYLGHDFQVYRWTTEVSPDLSVMFVGQATAGLNYYF